MMYHPMYLEIQAAKRARAARRAWWMAGSLMAVAEMALVWVARV